VFTTADPIPPAAQLTSAHLPPLAVLAGCPDPLVRLEAEWRTAREEEIAAQDALDATPTAAKGQHRAAAERLDAVTQRIIKIEETFRTASVGSAAGLAVLARVVAENVHGQYGIDTPQSEYDVNDRTTLALTRNLLTFVEPAIIDPVVLLVAEHNRLDTMPIPDDAEELPPEIADRITDLEDEIARTPAASFAGVVAVLGMLRTIEAEGGSEDTDPLILRVMADICRLAGLPAPTGAPVMAESPLVAIERDIERAYRENSDVLCTDTSEGRAAFDHIQSLESAIRAAPIRNAADAAAVVRRLTDGEVGLPGNHGEEMPMLGKLLGYLESVSGGRPAGVRTLHPDAEESATGTVEAHDGAEVLPFSVAAE